MGTITLNVGQRISSQHCDEGVVLPKLSFVCQSLRSGFSNANSAHEKAMMVDEGRRAGDERKRVIDIIERHHRKLVS